MSSHPPRLIAHLTTVDLSLRYLLLAQIDEAILRGDEVVGIRARGPDVSFLERGMRFIELRARPAPWTRGPMSPHGDRVATPVWATPMLQSVASAQAAASCGLGVLDWDNFRTGSTFTSTIIGNTTITLGIATSPARRSRRQRRSNVNAGIPGKSLGSDERQRCSSGQGVQVPI